MALLESNRQRYRAQLQEPAKVFSIQPSVLLENDKDVFEGSGGAGERYAVYKVDPAMNELAKTDKPQWITVWWNGDLLDPVGKQHIDAIVNNFDFSMRTISSLILARSKDDHTDPSIRPSQQWKRRL